MNEKEYVGMQEIAEAAGVSYNELWVAVRSARITLRLDTARTNTPPVANPQEIQRIHAQLRPEITPRPDRGQQALSGEHGAMDAFSESLQRLESRCEYEKSLLQAQRHMYSIQCKACGYVFDSPVDDDDFLCLLCGGRD